MVDIDLSAFADVFDGSTVIALGVGTSGIILGLAARQFTTDWVENRASLGGTKQAGIVAATGLGTSMLLLAGANALGENVFGGLLAVASLASTIATVVALQNRGTASALPAASSVYLPSAHQERRVSVYDA